MSQLNFNMMDAAGYGFYRVWVERAYLLKLATIPLLIKFACMITVTVLGLENNILRQGLILFPGVLAEGWVLAQFLRTLLRGERWPTVLPIEIDDALVDKLLLRARGILASTLVYGLIAVSIYLVRYVAFALILGNSNVTDDDVSDLLRGGDPSMADGDNKTNLNPMMLFPVIGMVIGMVWAFRLMWVYIPLSVLMPVRDYLKSLGGMLASLKMMILFFCTMTPIMFVTIMVSHLVFGMTDTLGENGEGVGRFIMVFVAVIADTMVGLVSTAAFVWAMKDFLPKNTDLLKDLPKIGGEK